MRRSDLEIGERYAGPEGKCYEIVDLSPGWRVNRAGQWVEDLAERTRYMPGKGSTPYRSNLSVRAYLIHEDASPEKAVIDPRRLMCAWTEYEARKSLDEVSRVHTSRLVALLRRNLRNYPGYVDSSAEDYGISSDGTSVTLPMRDLSALMDIAFGDGS